MKEFQATRGIQMDESFEAHVAQGCEKCRQFKASKPATAAAMCLEGAVLHKRDNAVRPPAQRVDKPDNFATKGQMKAAMRYKGE